MTGWVGRHFPAVRLGLIIVLALSIPPVVAAQYLRDAVELELGDVDSAERLRTAETTALLVGEVIRGAGDELELLASRRLIRKALDERDVDAIEGHIADLRAVSQRYASAAVFDPAGVMIVRNPHDSVVGRSFATRDDVVGALAGSSPHVSEPYLSATAAAEPLIAITLAVRDGARVLGILQVTIATDQLAGLVAPAAAVEGREILVADDQRRVIASTAGRAPLTTAPVAEIAGPPIARLTTVEGQERLIANVRVPNTTWRLALFDDPAIAMQPQKRVRTAIELALAGVLAAALALGAAVAWLSEQRRTAALETRRALLAQERANKELLRLDQAKTEFVSIVSHEIRTPLTGILGFSEMLRDEPLEAAEVREYAADIHGEAQRLGRLVNDMLDLDRMRSGRMRLDIRTIDLNAIVREAVVRAGKATDSHVLTAVLDPDLPPIEGDHDRIVQVVANLLGNAVKYSREGGTIVVVTRAGTAEVVIDVRDQGIGIPEEALPTIFERFTRVESDEMRGISGTGLGLPIVKEIVELHGGRVSAVSAPGRGSTFSVVLPVAHPAASASGETA